MNQWNIFQLNFNFRIIFSVAYTADEVQYKWLSGSTPVGLEGDLQMSQFDLQAKITNVEGLMSNPM